MFRYFVKYVNTLFSGFFAGAQAYCLSCFFWSDDKVCVTGKTDIYNDKS